VLALPVRVLLAGDAAAAAVGRIALSKLNLISMRGHLKFKPPPALNLSPILNAL
jgi:hypothetical protein